MIVDLCCCLFLASFLGISREAKQRERERKRDDLFQYSYTQKKIKTRVLLTVI